MRIGRGYRSSNVDDRRGQRFAGGGGGLGGGGVQLLSFLFSRFGLPGILIGGALLYFMGGGLGGLGGGGQQAVSTDPLTSQEQAEEQPLVELVSFVLDDAQNTWSQLFAAQGAQYKPARLTLFRDRIPSACGMGQAAMGPFYCPADERVYIDLAFYDELKRRLGAPGDFAQAYVIAHEVGHHVQKLLGTNERVHSAPASQQRGEDGLLVKLELQADCYAGIWAHGTQRRDILEAGDLDEALNAASKIGDDALQKQAGGAVRPESFTHGTSAQRKAWFKKGYDTGSPDVCDTFR